MIKNGGKYGLKHLIIFPFSCAALPSFLQLLIFAGNAALPALKVMASAAFIDSALKIAGQGSLESVLLPLFFLFGLLAYEMISGNISTLLRQKIKLKLRSYLCADVLEKQAKLKYEYIEDNETWGLITRMSKYVGWGRCPIEERIETGFTGLLQITSMVVSLISIVIIVASYSIWIALLLLAFFVPMFFVAYKNGVREYATSVENAQSHRLHNYFFYMLISREQADERALFSCTPFFVKKFLKYFDLARKAFLKMTGAQVFSEKFVSVAMGLALCVVFVSLLSPVSSGVMSAGVMIALVQAIISMSNIMGNSFGPLIREIIITREFMTDLTKFVNLEETTGATLTPVRGLSLESLEFKNVTFRYPGTERDILRNVSFKVEKNRHYAFVGENGAGKTTIAKLITGLYDNYEGEILINGEEIRSFPYEMLKGYSICVFQDFAKYEITMRENIAIGATGLQDIDRKVEEAAISAGLEETINSLPNNIDQYLGRLEEDGQDISGGQWQRVAIARATVSPAPLRILDEPTAALDPVSESRVYEQFEAISHNMTTIFITHRLGSTKLADEIFVLDGGTIAEHGSHEDLMSCTGIYARMYDSQRSWYL